MRTGLTPASFVDSLLILLTVLTIHWGCQGDVQSDTASDVSNENEEMQQEKPDLHTITIDGVPLQVEIAQDPETLADGLMFREQLDENEGMLFVFESTRVLSFWMRNTFIPLDIAFIDEHGTIVDIQQMQALDESKQYISKRPALYALEVNAGWFQRNNINVGSQVNF